MATNASVSVGRSMSRGAHRVWRWGTKGGGVVSKSEGEVSTSPTLIPGITNASHIAVGKDHSAFVVGGQVYTYGCDKYNKLGYTHDEADTSASSSSSDGESSSDGGKVPRLVHDVTDIQSLALGQYHTCALDTDGNLFSWGWKGSFWGGCGALGIGDSSSDGSTPTLVEGFDEKIVQVAAGAQHTLALTESGRVFSTGSGEYGLLGVGDNSDSTEFEEVDYFSEYRDTVLAAEKRGTGEPVRVVKIACGNYFSAALTVDGELFVWGRNDYSQLGLGDDNVGDMYSSERYPRLIRSLGLEGHRVKDFSCGDFHMDALMDNGQIYTWGNRNWMSPHPISLNGIHEQIVKLVGGGKFSLALTDTGEVYGWGKKPCIPKDSLNPAKFDQELFQKQKVVDIEACDGRCLAITEDATGA